MRHTTLVLAGVLSLSLLRAQSSLPQRNPFEAVPAPPQPVSAPSEFTIEAVEFRGAKRIPTNVLRALVQSRVGAAYDIETLRRDLLALQQTGRFSTVILETEPGGKGAIVRFVLAERALIQALRYQGDDSLTMAEILDRFELRKIRLRSETLLDEAELARAAATIQQLLEERGRRNVSVTPSVEPTGPLLVWPSPTVKVTFTVAPKR